MSVAWTLALLDGLPVCRQCGAVVDNPGPCGSCDRKEEVMKWWVIETPYFAEMVHTTKARAEQKRKATARRESCCAKLREATLEEVRARKARQPDGPRMSDCERAFMGTAPAEKETQA